MSFDVLFCLGSVTVGGIWHQRTSRNGGAPGKYEIFFSLQTAMQIYRQYVVLLYYILRYKIDLTTLIEAFYHI